MASSTLIGTAPDQVPTNGDLGDLAFQNKESIEFYNGRGGLGHLDITAVSRQLNISAQDIFVYDTSKDSDGGAWRNRCQHTAWYNEPLNTTTRGARREFPSVAVIVALSNGIQIYDGDDPTLPLWIDFTHANFGWDTNILSVAAVNATITMACIGGTGYSGNGLRILNLISETFLNDTTNITYQGQTGGTYGSGGISSTTDLRYTLDAVRPFQGSLASYMVRKVAIAVLPGAPIDPVTGLPIPTIAVGTNNGFNVVHWDKSIATVTFNDANDITDIAMTDKYVLFTCSNFTHAMPIPYGTINNTGRYLKGAYDTAFLAPRIGYNGDSFVTSDPSSYGGSVAGTITDTTFVVKSEYNLFQALIDNPKISNKITNTYNSGWMPGDVRGTWLSSNTSEVLYGIVTPDPSTWTGARGGSVSVSGSTVTVSSGSSASWNGGMVTLSNLIPGRQYAAKINASSVTSPTGGGGWYLWRTLDSGGAHSSLMYSSATYGYSFQTPLTANTDYWLVWTAAYSTEYIILEAAVASTGGSVVFSDFAVYRTEQDCATYNRGLIPIGYLNKTPVAEGSELVAYSGFTDSTAYLLQPTNDLYDVGTGDFCVMGWFNVPTTGGHPMFGMGDPNSNNGFLVGADSGGIDVGILGLNNSFTESVYGSKPAFVYNTWTHVTYVRRSGREYIYINGVLKASYISATATVNFTTYWTAGRRIKLGGRAGTAASMPDGMLALWKFAASAPTGIEIYKIFSDEKRLFEPNAKAMLYGSNFYGVSGAAFDTETKLLHVGTTSGRSVFQGLRRVDNTTTGVSSVISAAGGLVAEN